MSIKKFILITFVTLFATMAAPSFAAPGDQGQGGQNQDRFKEAKQKISQRIQDRINKMQERLTCVNNAQDRKSLKACFPDRGDRDDRRGPGAGNK